MYLLNILIAIDQLGNTLAGGHPDVTISARVGYQCWKHEPGRYWRALRWVIDTTFKPIDGPGHCIEAYFSDVKGRHNSGSDAARLVLGVLVLAGCAVLAPIIRVVGWFVDVQEKEKAQGAELDDNAELNALLIAGRRKALDDNAIEELKQLAMAASLGPWVPGWGAWVPKDYSKIGSDVCAVLNPKDASQILAITGSKNSDQSRADAEYIAAANPEAVLDLIARIQFLKEWTRRVKDLVDARS